MHYAPTWINFDSRFNLIFQALFDQRILYWEGGENAPDRTVLVTVVFKSFHPFWIKQKFMIFCSHRNATLKNR